MFFGESHYLRLYFREKMDKGGYILNDKHEVLNLYSSQCAICKHFKEDSYSCAAFPEGIPDEILDGSKKHNSVLPSQKGTIVFSKKEGYENIDL